MWLRRRAVAVSRALLCVALLALHGVRTGRAQADGASDGECACACEHCGADDDSEHATLPASDSDRDTSSGGGRPPDTVEQPGAAPHTPPVQLSSVQRQHRCSVEKL